MSKFGLALAEIMLTDWKEKLSAEAAYDIVEDQLPEIIDSLELPPPLNSFEQAIAKRIRTGFGGFRPGNWEHLLRRVENAPVVAELRAIKRRRAAYEGAGASMEQLPVHLGEQEASTFHTPEALTDSASIARAQSPIATSTHLAKEPGDQLAGRYAEHGSPKAFSQGEGVPLAADSTMLSIASSPERRVEDLGSTDFDQEDRDAGNRIELDQLVSFDLRDCWARIEEGRLQEAYRTKPQNAASSGTWNRIPRTEPYKSVQYGALLERLTQLSLTANSEADSVRKEILILSALLETVSVERQWELLNERRQYLIIKKHTAGLSRNEDIEYEKLQGVAEKRISRFAPAPLDRISEIDRYIALAGLDS